MENATRDTIENRIANYFIVCLALAVGVATVLTNGFVILAAFKYGCLRKDHNYYVRSLAVADIIAGLLVTASSVGMSYGYPKDFYSCLFANCLIRTLLNVSILSLGCVVVDRFMSICYPIKHLKITKRWTVRVAAGCWVLGTCIGLIPFMGWHNDPQGFIICAKTRIIPLGYSVYVITFGFLIPIFLTVFVLQALSLNSLRKVNKRLIENVSSGSYYEATIRVKRTEGKLVKTMVIIFVIFGVCWLPLNITHCLQLWYPSLVVPESVIDGFVILTLSNCFFNPLVYACRQSDIRHLFRNLVHPLAATLHVTDMSTTGP